MRASASSRLSTTSPAHDRCAVERGAGLALLLHVLTLAGLLQLHEPPLARPDQPAAPVELVMLPEPPQPQADPRPARIPDLDPADASSPTLTATAEPASAPLTPPPPPEQIATPETAPVEPAPVDPASVEPAPADLVQADPAPAPSPEPVLASPPPPPLATSPAAELASAIPSPPIPSPPTRLHPPKPRAHAAAPKRLPDEPPAPAHAQAAPLTAPPAAPRAESRPDPGREAEFEARIRDAVQAAIRYPPAARMMGLTGRSRLALTYRAGTITEVALALSAGVPALDDAAASAARAARYPMPPPDIGDRRLRFLIWVDFKAGV